MLYIYGDSHARFSFKDLEIPHRNYQESSVTMHRIGRDNNIINFDNSCNNLDSIVCITYGEVDCRCHIKRQVNLGRDEDEVIQELISAYFNTIRHNILNYKKIVIVAITPPRNQAEFEKEHGPITHEYPFVGSDDDRIRFTNKMNNLIEVFCNKNNYIYFNPHSFYTGEDGTLKYELSDSNVHIGNNTYFLEKFRELYKDILDGKL